MQLLSHDGLDQVIASYGYFAVSAAVGLESMGLPVPGETMLVLAAMYAAIHSDLNIWLVILAAATGAVVGDNLGYWLGGRYGYPLLRRFGGWIGLSDSRIKIGQYLFLRHGAKVVFFGRFVALLRMLAAALAGVNRMPWRTFVIANALGGLLWAAFFALGGYVFGSLVFRLQGIVAPIAIAAAAIAFFGAGFLIQRFEDRLHTKAERAIPGPLV